MKEPSGLGKKTCPARQLFAAAQALPEGPPNALRRDGFSGKNRIPPKEITFHLLGGRGYQQKSWASKNVP